MAGKLYADKYSNSVKPINQMISKLNQFFKQLDRQKYPFVDGLYYLFILVFLLILFLFFA